MRECREEDFGDTDYAKKKFATWKDYLIVCPDLKDDEELYFKGDHSSM